MASVNVFSPNFELADSYGRLASELSSGLENRGVSVNRIGGHAPQHQPMTPVMGGFVLGYPTNFHKFGVLASGGARVAVTMFEASCLPEGWADVLNTCDAVIVPARFLVDVFRKSGVQVPIHVVPLGISSEFIDPVIRDKRVPFTVLAIADRGRRKGWWEAAMGFYRAFGDNTDFKLILKSRSLSARFTNPNVEALKGDMSNDELAALYQRCHVMVFPTHGEGFGLPPREFAATGGIAIATNWGGTADDIQHWGVPLDYTMEDAFPQHGAFAGAVGQWAKPDVEHIKTLLRQTAMYYKYYETRAAKAAGFVRDTYDWQTFADKCLQIYNDIAEVKYGSNSNRA